ncbi:MAG: hypothetical protein H7248_01660 [Microbacteriaceae bacterium]|nr:hypothetical protein [Microbacteriaceae bacterium]
MPRKQRAGEYTLRSGSSVFVFWIGAVIMVIVVAASVAGGDWRVFAFEFVPALLIVWVLWIALYRPSIHYDEHRAVVVNIGRTHVLPWARVDSVRQRIGLAFELDAGRIVTAVGVPAPRPVGNVASNFDRRTRPTNHFNASAELLESVRVAAAPTTDQVVSRWDTLPLALGAVLVVAVAVEVLFGV